MIISIARDFISGNTSYIEAPFVTIFTKPIAPNVDGKMYEKSLSHSGMAWWGYETPESINSGIDVHSNSISELSRLRNRVEATMAKIMHAARYIIRNITMADIVPFIG